MTITFTRTEVEAKLAEFKPKQIELEKQTQFWQQILALIPEGEPQ